MDRAKIGIQYLQRLVRGTENKPSAGSEICIGFKQLASKIFYLDSVETHRGQ